MFSLVVENILDSRTTLQKYTFKNVTLNTVKMIKGWIFKISLSNNSWWPHEWEMWTLQYGFVSGALVVGGWNRHYSLLTACTALWSQVPVCSLWTHSAVLVFKVHLHMHRWFSLSVMKKVLWHVKWRYIMGTLPCPILPKCIRECWSSWGFPTQNYFCD